MHIRTLEDGLEIHRVVAPAEIDAFRGRFAAAYVDVFAQPPYRERFTVEEAERLWDRLAGADDAIVLLVLDGETLIAFAIGVPLPVAPDVARELTGLVPSRQSMYLAELGVVPGHSRPRFARLLAHMRLKLVDQSCFSHVVLRAPQNVRDTLEMYRELGFTDMGVSMEVTRLRTDGTVRSDERTFMSRVRSLVEVDDDDPTDTVPIELE